MAARAGAEFYPIPIRQSDLADHFADAIWHAETLCFNAHGVAKYLLSRAVRDAGYKVVLTGEGSDEILGGYVHFRRDMLLYDNEGQDSATVATLLEQLETGQSGLARPAAARRAGVPTGRASSGVLGFMPSWIETVGTGASSCGRCLPTSSPTRIRATRRFSALLEQHRRRRPADRTRPVNQSLYLWSKTVLPELHPHHAR